MTDPIQPQPKPKGIAPAQTEQLTLLAQYQDGAIVSREIIKKQTGTVSVFAFDAGQGLSEHTAPFDALVQVLEGTVEIRIAGQPHRLRAGDVILMPAGQPHALQAIDRFKMMLTMIRS
jgi:quercetin dioxygenase-like cupin family protein